MTAISYASTSVVLNDRSVYHSFLRTVPSDEVLLSAVGMIMNRYGWKQLSIFTEEQAQYLQFNQRLKTLLRKTSLLSRATSYTFGSEQVKNYSIFANELAFIFNERPHIFLVNTGHQMATHILCSGYHNGRFYPNYAWILLGHHNTDWWRKHYMETNCSDSDMMKVLNKSLILVPYPDNKNEQQIYKYTEQIQAGDLYNVSAYASDAVRVLAETLHNCLNRSGPTNENDCKGSNLDWNVTLSAGKTGLFRLSSSNDRDASTTVVQQHQFQRSKNSVRSVGLVMKLTNQSYQFSTFTNISVWPDGVPPDGTPTTAHILIHGAIITLQFLMSGVTLACILVCFVFTLIFKKRKIVKLTSPTLNCVLLLGLAIFVLGPLHYPSTSAIAHSIRCVINPIFSSLGYNTIIAVALVKTCRVHYIFKKPSPNKREFRDWHLLLIVLIIVAVNMVILVPILIPDIVTGNLVKQQSTGNPVHNDQGIITHLVISRCNNSLYFSIFSIVGVAYIFVIHIIALVLACLIRKVKIDVLNDSRETRALIYISTILMVVYFSIQFTLYEFATLIDIAWALLIFIGSMIILGLTFIPKFVALYKDPKGVNVFKKASAVTTLDITSESVMATCKTNDVLEKKTTVPTSSDDIPH